MRVRQSIKFKRDIKRCKRQGKDIDEIKRIIRKLAIPEKLDDRNRDHDLTGQFNGCRECHISPDWLLVYRYSDGVLELVRTGSHSEILGM